MAIFLIINYKNIKTYLTVKSNKANKELSDFFSKTKKELSDYFEIEAFDPPLFLLDNRKDLNIILGRDTEPWFVGVFKGGNIYMLNPEVFEKESNHKKEEFWVILKHEYVHVCYVQITRSFYPIWLNEGLASFLSGKKITLGDDFYKKSLNIFNYFNKSDKDVYAIGQFWVEFLLDKYGRKKFLKLIKGLNSCENQKQFSEVFFDCYGFGFNKEEFSKFLK